MTTNSNIYEEIHPLGKFVFLYYWSHASEPYRMMHDVRSHVYRDSKSAQFAEIFSTKEPDSENF